jgi:hypothetical protein
VAILPNRKHLAAYLLLLLGGKESPSADDIKTLLGTVGIASDDSDLNRLLGSVEGMVGTPFTLHAHDCRIPTRLGTPLCGWYERGKRFEKKTVALTKKSCNRMLTTLTGSSSEACLSWCCRHGSF